MPDGTFEEVPSDATDEEIAAYLQYRREFSSQRDPSSSGIGSLRRGEDEGTTLGAAWQGLKNIPRGARQFGLSALQGIEAIRTPDEDTAREKDLRRRLNELYTSQDPRYADSNLAQLGMGLGQVGAMVGTSLIPYVGPGIALGGATLMGAGEAAGRIAEYEARTGEDVSAGKERLALAGGLGLGLLEMAGPARLAKLARPLTRSARRLLPATGARAADAIAGRSGELAGRLGFAGREARDYLTSGLKATAIEGVQEGVSSFGQSALAQHLYDENALADAPASALKEAIIGGQVGGVADVLLRMAGGRRRLRSSRLQGKMEEAIRGEAKKAWDDKDDGAFDRATFVDRVNSQNPKDQEFIAGIEDGTLSMEEATQSIQRQEEIRSDTELDDAQRSEQLEEEVRKTTLAQSLLAKMRYGIDAVRQDNLADGSVSSEPEVVAPPEQPTQPISEQVSQTQERASRVASGEVTVEDADYVARSNMSGVPEVSNYDAADVLDKVNEVADPEAPVTEGQRGFIAELTEAAEAEAKLGPAKVRELVVGATPTIADANKVINAVLAFDSLADLGTQVIDPLRQDEAVDRGREGLAVKVPDKEVIEIVDAFRKDGATVTEDLAQRALDAKAIGKDLTSFAAETLELDPADASWDSLQDGEQQAVFSRILRSDVQRIEGESFSFDSQVTPEEGQAILRVVAGGKLEGVAPKVADRYSQVIGGGRLGEARSPRPEEIADASAEGLQPYSVGLPATRADDGTIFTRRQPAEHADIINNFDGYEIDLPDGSFIEASFDGSQGGLGKGNRDGWLVGDVFYSTDDVQQIFDPSFKGQVSSDVVSEADLPTAVGDAYVITQEAVSVGRQGFMAVLAESSAEVRERFTLAMRSALTDANGKDRTLGIVERLTETELDVEVLPGRGLWGGDLNPNEIVVLRTEFDQTNEKQVALENRVVEVYMAVNGIVRGQDAQAAARVRPKDDTTGGDADGWLIGNNTGDKVGALDPVDVDRVLETLGELGYGATSIDTHGNILVIDYYNEGGAALKEVMDGMAADESLAVEPRRFDSKYMDGTRAFLETIKGNRRPKSLKKEIDEMVAILDDNVTGVYATFAAELGLGPESYTGLTARVEELNALGREVTGALPSGQRGKDKTGKAFIGVLPAAKRLAEANDRTKVKSKSEKTIVKTLAERLTASVGRFVEGANVSDETASDWYKQGALESRLIAQLSLPELRNDKDYTLFTIISSILSNGSEVDNELSSAVGVMEQYYRTGVFSLLEVDEKTRELVGGEKQTFKVERGKKTPRTVSRQRSFRGRRAPGLPTAARLTRKDFDSDAAYEEFLELGTAERVPGSVRSLTHEAAFEIVNDMMADLGKSRTAKFLLGTVERRKAGKLQDVPVLQELFGEKIGRYAGDKLGLPSRGEATLDLWMARGYHMLMGTFSRKKNSKGNWVINDEITPVMRERLNDTFEAVAAAEGVPISTVQAKFWYAVKWEFREQAAREKAGAYATLPSAITKALLSPRSNARVRKKVLEIISIKLDMGVPTESLSVAEGWDATGKWNTLQGRKEYQAAKEEAALASAGVANEDAAPIVVTPVVAKKQRKGVYKKIRLGRPGKRSVEIRSMAETLGLDPEQVADYLNRAVAHGVIRYTDIKRSSVAPAEPGQALVVATEKALEQERVENKLRQEGEARSEKQFQQDAKDLTNAKSRLESFKQAARRNLTKMGKSEVGINISVAADSIYARIEDIYNDPDIIVQSKAYEVGPSAEIRNHGAMVLFNLSQMESTFPGGIETDIDTLISETAFHEGAHLWYLNDDLTRAEQKSLEKYGKSQRVPEAVDRGAYDKELTWRQWTESMYGESDPNIVEETSVRILDALAAGKIPKNKSAGIMAKIYNDLRARAKALVSAANDSDVLPAVKVFAKVQDGEMRRRSEVRDLELKGMSPTQILARSAPEQYQALKEAAETGDEGELAAAARAIVRSKSDGPTISLQQSLLNDLRARREIEDTPGSVTPVLNKHNIEEGRISAAALNAYFDFNDQSVRPYSFLEGTRYKQGEEGYQEQQMLLAQSGEREGGPNEGITTAKEFAERVEYTALDILRMKLVDKRLPQWFSEKQKAAREGAHKILAYASAIAAWRQADNSLLYTSSIMELGPAQWIRDRAEGDRANGGLSFDEDLEVDGRPVKGMKAIAAPIIAKGEKFVALLYDFLTAHRIVDVNEKKLEAQRKLAAAQKVDADALALNPTPAPDPELLPPPELPPGLKKGAPEYIQAKLEFDSDIDKAAYIVGSRKKLSKGDDKYVAWLAERGVDLEGARLLHGRVVAIAASRSDGEAGQVITVPADPGANRRFNPKVVRPPGSTAPSTMEKLEREARAWEEYYEAINPKNPKKRGNPRTITIKDAKALIRRVETSGGDGEILTQFKQEYADFNWWMVEFLYETGEVTLDKKLTLQEISYVPFHRDQGWADAQPLVNTKNKNVRGPSMIERELTGSVAPLDKDLFGQITDNITAIMRDGLANIASQRSVRDELSNETAMEIRPGKAAEDNEAASELGFSDVAIRLKIDGKARIFRVRDPLLSQSIMTMGFNPISAIEDFYGSVFRAGGKTLGIRNESIVSGLTALSTGPSKILRELVTRSPPFIAKNILRDSMSASVVYGGGPLMTLRALRNVLFDGNLLEKARARGIGQPVDFVTDPGEFKSRAQKLLSQDEIRGLTDGIPVLSTVWDALGQASRKSEVATRMAVYDAVIRDTTTEAMPKGDRVEALHQATEIMNYGRRGSSPTFSLFASMAPFINGRIQGLDVVLRTHLASQDAPGLYDKDFDDTPAGRLRQAKTAATRGAYLAFGTFLYWLAVHDDEEYKNTPSDLKNDWWLIPVPGSRLGVKIPIPFEVGVLYKVIPEQILRTLSEDEHSFGDMTSEMKRQVISTLWLDLRPQAIRPMIDAMANRNAFTRRQIVPTYMNNSVAASEQYNPATNEIARLISGSLDNIPLLKSMDFLTSPMKMEYMLRQYGGTLGTYVMVLADRATREAGGRNIVGTPADFGFGSIDKMPMMGDLLYDREAGGGYQESFYDMLEDVDKIVATLKEMEGREDRDRTAEERYEDENDPLFRVEDRLEHFEKRMDHWRKDRDRLFTRNDLSDQDKRRTLYRMFEDRDDILSEMLELMGDVRGQ